MKIPEGYEIDENRSTFVFKKIKKELPKSWEELEKIEGFYSCTDSEIHPSGNCYCTESMKNVFPTEEQVEASIALAQLSQLRDVYRDGWIPNWIDGNTKYTIELFKGKVFKDVSQSYDSFLSFQNHEKRDLFLENFRDLIEKAKPLMS